MVQGLDFEKNSPQEALAIGLLRRKEEIEFLKHLSLIGAINKSEKLPEIMKKLLNTIFPEEAEEDVRHIERTKKMLEAEMKKVIHVESLLPKSKGLSRKS